MTPTKNYYRIMAGAGSSLINECIRKGYVGGDWDISMDLSNSLPEDFRDFNQKMIPVFLEINPEKSKIAAGLACGMLHTICKGVSIGDVVLTPNGKGVYHVGEVVSDYFYVPGEALPHRRQIKWFEKGISREEMSQALKNSAGSIGTVSNLTKYSDEIEAILDGPAPPSLIHTDERIEDPTAFALERHLEDFLITNWQYTELGKDYDIYTVDDEIVGQQFQTDTGPIDILAISKDRSTLLIVELKKGRASDAVVGQIQRYMGYINDDMKEKGQQVKGAIIALEDDLRIRRALSVTSNIEFYKYQIRFNLEKVF